MANKPKFNEFKKSLEKSPRNLKAWDQKLTLVGKNPLQAISLMEVSNYKNQQNYFVKQGVSWK